MDKIVDVIVKNVMVLMEHALGVNLVIMFMLMVAVDVLLSANIAKTI